MGICRRPGSGCGPGSAPGASSPSRWPWTPPCPIRPCKSTTWPPSKCCGQPTTARPPPDAAPPPSRGQRHQTRQPSPAASHPPSGPPHPAAGGVSRLDRVTLQLGVAVAVVIAVCSYAVSATSLYALGVQAGYSWWQAAAVPVVADGPAIYGMFRIISRSRRNAKGAGYGWLLVIAGTLASIGGSVAHAQDDLVAQAIAAAIPLAVLAMLEGLKGDAG